MEHYSAEAWLQYVEGSVGAAQAKAMEDHLEGCTSCLKLYALVAESLVDPQVSPRFTQKVMEQVITTKRGRRRVQARTERAPNSRQSFGNYAVAACLTLFLTAAGVFGNLTSVLPDTGSKISLAETAAEKVGSGWSENIAEKTLSILDIIKPQ